MRVSLPSGGSAGRPAAFTLIELLIVIAIIGILASVGLPALKGFNKSNAITAADRQMLDDVANARQLAIANHTDVYMVFMPPTNITSPPFPASLLNDPVAGPIITNLLTMEYTGYALYSERSVGDQPGQSSPQYLTPWRRLPEGMFIATSKFNQFQSNNSADGWVSAFQYASFPFPLVNSNTLASQISLPYIQFNYLGQLTSHRDASQSSEIIPLARGSVMTNPPAVQFPTLPVDVLEIPPNNSTNTLYNHVRIDWLTGRARVEQQQIQ
jgi:type IV fimbrial biogenesis protein FimT